MTGSYYGEASAPSLPRPALRLGSVLISLFVTKLVVSGLAFVVVATIVTQPGQGSPGGLSPTSSMLATYLVPVAVAILVGGMVLPPVLRELTGFRIEGVAAAVVVGAGALTGLAIRYLFVELALEGSRRYNAPTPASLSSSLLLSWLAWIAGYAVSVQLVRRYAVPAEASSAGSGSYDSARRNSSGGGLALMLVIALALAAIIAVSVRHRFEGTTNGVVRGATVSTSDYAAELRDIQAAVFDIFNVVATGPAEMMPTRLLGDQYTLEGETEWLVTHDPNNRAARAHARLVRGLRLFTLSLPQIANRPTTSAQQRALLKAPGIRTIGAALRDLQAEVITTGPRFFDPTQWSTLLRQRRTT